MKRLLYYFSVLTFLILIFLLDIITYGKKPFAFQVQIREPGIATTNDGNKLYLMDVSYSFPGKNNIYLDNVGTIPASGDLKFFSEGKTLFFRNYRYGKVIEAATYWGKYKDLGNSTIPSEREYPEALQHHKWIRPPEFPSSLFDTLLKYRKDSISSPRDQFSNIRTDWFILPNLPQNLRGQVSFMFSCPSEPQTDKFTFAEIGDGY